MIVRRQSGKIRCQAERCGGHPILFLISGGAQQALQNSLRLSGRRFHIVQSANNPSSPACRQRGFPIPNTFSIRIPRFLRCGMDQVALLIFSIPRSQLRLAPPVSQTWAKLRSTFSLRSCCSSFPLSRLIRRRLFTTAC